MTGSGKVAWLDDVDPVVRPEATVATGCWKMLI